jgi:inosine triphosphate pyrophosphatase
MIYFITGNQNKLREAQSVIPDLVQLDIDLPEIQETDPHKIIQAKLHEAKKHYDGEFIVEDTSLYMKALNDSLPGPLIKWFLKSLGNEGIAKIAARFGVHEAKAATILGHMNSRGEISYFEGDIAGHVVYPRGETNFGWDPIFQPEGSLKTFAEMTKEEKNAISMRKVAFTKLKSKISS